MVEHISGVWDWLGPMILFFSFLLSHKMFLSPVCQGWFVLELILEIFHCSFRNKTTTSAHVGQGNEEVLFVLTVLQGLVEVKSPYLEELLSLLMTVGTQAGTGTTAGPVAMVISLLLHETEEQAVKMEVDSNK